MSGEPGACRAKVIFGQILLWGFVILLMARFAGIMAGALLVATTICAAAAGAEQYVAHTDMEFRVGEDALCGTCDPRRYRTAVQVFADRLFPIARIGDGALEIGPYAKGALLDGGHVPQFAGGAAVGYRINRFEVVVNVGLAYATEGIGTSSSDDSSQTRATYDLGLSLRYDIDRYYLTVGYKHNSNGESLGLNVLGPKEHNSGIDGVFAGIGIRF